MTTDNGAAALARDLHDRDIGCEWHQGDDPDVAVETHASQVAAILANGAVFLSDGRELERLREALEESDAFLALYHNNARPVCGPSAPCPVRAQLQANAVVLRRDGWESGLSVYPEAAIEGGSE